MRRNIFMAGLVVGLLAIIMFTASPTAAKKPSRAGNDESDRHSQNYEPQSQEGNHHRHGDRESSSGRHGGPHHDFFSGHDRAPIDHYYAERFRAGKCPPGLAKKGHGCRPHGHARMWVLHRPLPPKVIYHELPPTVLVHLGPPPPGHRFVRVAQDILMIAAGTGMVVDAMEDLGR
ncbi:MAG: RcnB family protein [Desulfatitalea sp.]